MPITTDELTRFMTVFAKANCRSINTLCLCRCNAALNSQIEIDFREVANELLQEFLECDNMKNLEVLSFKSGRSALFPCRITAA